MNSIIHLKDKKIKNNKIKKALTSDILFFILVLLFSSSLSFFLGRISMLNFSQDKNSQSIKIKKVSKLESNKEIEKTQIESMQVVASKKGSVYHLPWCSGALRLKKENKIFFKNKTYAEKAGYRPAKNCEGL